MLSHPKRNHMYKLLKVLHVTEVGKILEIAWHIYIFLHSYNKDACYANR